MVFCTKPFKKPGVIVDYLGRYVYKIAIDSYRIIKLENYLVYIKYKDYRDMKTKIMRLNPLEFIRRILLHVLPVKFQKVSYYRFLGNNKKEKNLELCRKLLNIVFDVFSEFLSRFKNDIKKAVCVIKGIDHSLCPFCKVGRMSFYKSDNISLLLYKAN